MIFGMGISCSSVSHMTETWEHVELNTTKEATSPHVDPVQVILQCERGRAEIIDHEGSWDFGKSNYLKKPCIYGKFLGTAI